MTDMALNARTAVDMFIDVFDRAKILKYDYKAKDELVNVLKTYVFDDPSKANQMADMVTHKILAAVQVAFCEGYHCGVESKNAR